MFVGMQIEWYVCLMLVIDVDVDCDECFGVVVFICVFFFQIVWYFLFLCKVSGVLIMNCFFMYVGVINMVQ